MIPLFCNEIRRLWATFTRRIHPKSHTDHWSLWRLRHQTRTRHYQRQHARYNVEVAGWERELDAFVDVELYLPASWTSNPDRLAAASVPEEVEFAT